MKTDKNTLRKLNLSKLKIAIVRNPENVCGGSIEKETENCHTATICASLHCGIDTIDTQ